MADQANAATKIFLSHKGSDKPMVQEFERVLSLLGFEPWIDTQMTAGQNPDRAILNGLKDSCAAVFFITSSFKDEAWIAQEIEWARAEKRSKADRFQIISLVFSDPGGNKGSVPDLLKSYIYKEPSSQLEGLHEILRALPRRVGTVDWADRSLRGAAALQAVHEALDASRGLDYTRAKTLVAGWARKHPLAFHPDQILPNGKFGSELLLAWQDYELHENGELRECRGIINKFWARLTDKFEASQVPYDHIFEAIGDNLWLLSVTHPLEILLTAQLGTAGKPSLSRLLTRFLEWVTKDAQREAEYRRKGLRLQPQATIWTECWPWK